MKNTAALATACGALLLSSLVWAAPEGECWYWDPIDERVNDCADAPTEETSEYVERVELGLIIREIYRDLFRVLYAESFLIDMGDEEYDAELPASVQDAYRAWVDYIWSKIDAGETIWTHDIRLNGVSRGWLWTDPADKKEAALVLHQAGNVVWGTVFVLEHGMEVDAGICGIQSVPTSSYAIRGVETTYGNATSVFRAEGATHRRVREGALSLSQNDVDAGFWLELDHTTDMVTGEIHIDVGGPCTGDTVHGEFVYDPTSYLYGS